MCHSNKNSTAIFPASQQNITGVRPSIEGKKQLFSPYYFHDAIPPRPHELFFSEIKYSNHNLAIYLYGYCKRQRIKSPPPSSTPAFLRDKTTLGIVANITALGEVVQYVGYLALHVNKCPNLGGSLNLLRGVGEELVDMTTLTCEGRVAAISHGSLGAVGRRVVDNFAREMDMSIQHPQPDGLYMGLM